MPTLNDLLVQPGDDVRTAWERLIAYEKSRRLIPEGAGIRLKILPEGTFVLAEEGGLGGRRFDHPWRPKLTADLRAALTPGTVNGISPLLEGVSLNGIDAEGLPVPVPPLDLSQTEPDEQGRTWIALAATPSADGTQAAYSIRHVAALGTTIAGSGLHPLVALYWTGGRITSHHQVTHHSLGHAQKNSAHYFWAV